MQRKQHIMKLTNEKKKGKIVASFTQYHYKREVYYERTVQVKHPLKAYYQQSVSKNAMLRQMVPSTAEIYQ